MNDNILIINREYQELEDKIGELYEQIQILRDKQSKLKVTKVILSTGLKIVKIGMVLFMIYGMIELMKNTFLNSAVFVVNLKKNILICVGLVLM